MARLMLFAAMLAIAGTATAQTPRADPCRDETTAGSRLCNRQRLQQAETELARILQQARIQAGADTATLDSAQAAWRLYVDLDCRAAARVYEGGSLAPVVAGQCRVGHTRARIRQLRADYLTNDGSPGQRP